MFVIYYKIIGLHDDKIRINPILIWIIGLSHPLTNQIVIDKIDGPFSLPAWFCAVCRGLPVVKTKQRDERKEAVFKSSPILMRAALASSLRPAVNVSCVIPTILVLYGRLWR